MESKKLSLSLFPERLAICRLDPSAPIPQWVWQSPFVSVTCTPDEISVVCMEDRVPSGVSSNRGWRYLGVDGPLSFSETGILLSLVRPLARVGVPVFAVSTHDTDYILLRNENLAEAVEALTRQGHDIRENKP